MESCLAHPEHGYYRTQSPLGRAGDFITAPEISQMFGELLGLWAAVVWDQMGSPTRISLVELGPGRGTLMSDALRALRGAPEMLSAVEVHLVDISPVLRQSQETTLAQESEIAWHTRLDDVPTGPVIILANEYLDALPVRHAVRLENAWHERVVNWDGGAFVFETGAELPPSIVPLPIDDAAVGDVYEWSTAVETVVAQISERVKADGGAALFVDYGYNEDGVGDTLQAVHDHTFANPLESPGECDLTAHVNFSCVSPIAEAHGARSWGPISQATLLERLGIGARTAALLTRATHEQAKEIQSARDRLTSPDAMGELFKAISITGPEQPAPPGFELSM